MNCNIKPNQVNYYIPENLDGKDLRIDQTVLIKSSDLKKIQFLDYQEQTNECPRSEDLYPYVNSYYCHTEDSDPLSKVNSLLAEPEFLKSIRDKENQRRIFTHDAYSERDIQLKYLQSKPVSFIILGKPDIGQQELGKELANYWGCVYIEPQTLIEEEIESGSRAGECIEFNLRSGRAIGIDIILRLVHKHVKSERCLHRGFVFCDLPVIPNDLYEEDPVSSQSAIFTAKDIFEEIFNLTLDPTTSKQSNPRVSVSSKFSSRDQSDNDESSIDDIKSSKRPVKNIKNAKTSVEETGNIETKSLSIDEDICIGMNYEKQLNFLFNLLEDPYFAIYLQCSAMDVLNKRDSYRFDYLSNLRIDLQRINYQRKLGEETFDDIEDFRLKQLVKHPRDFKVNVSSQLDNYHYAALNFVQHRILAHNPEYFIKLDGRTSVLKMFNILKAKLNVMNLQKVLNPKKLTDNDLEFYFKSENTLLAEDQEIEEEEKKLSPQECFKQLKKFNTVSPSFLWTWSEWGSKCPVALKQGFLKDGSVKYACQFMNKIFFLSDENAYFKFYQNPRPYLLPPFPRSTCKIFIFGPKRSGRTALAHCLAYYLGGSVLSADELMEEFMQQRQDEFLEKIKQKAIAEGIALLNKTRQLEAQENEKKRVEEIKEWVKLIIGLLEELENILLEVEREEKKEKFEISSFPMAMKTVQTSDALEDSELAVALTKLRQQLQDLNIPIYRLDPSTWKNFITDRKKLLQYLPTELSQKYHPKPATVFDDFVKDYVNNALSTAGLNELQISGGSIIEMFVRHIKIAEQKYEKQGLGRGGWVIDGMIPNLKMVQDFLPDYIGDEILVLKDSTNFLVENYSEHKSTYFRNFRTFFSSIKMQDAALRSPSLTSTEKDKTGMAKSILHDILESDAFLDIDHGTEDETQIDHRVEEYKSHITDFTKNWEVLNNFYKDHNINPIEIDVSNKTLPELFKQTIKTIESRYKYSAKPITEEDLAEEVANIGQDTKNQDIGETPTVVENTSDEIYLIKKYGDTFHYCPVTLFENFVLWKGKEDFACKFNDKTYLLATERDMKKFIDDPYSFLPLGYPRALPPPRICVIGVTGSGKTEISKSISENYGLIYLSYENFLKKCFSIFTNETFKDLTNSTITELRDYLNSKAPLPRNVYKQLYNFWFEEPFKSKGFVFDDFPKIPEDIEFMVENKLIPDLVLYLHGDETYLRTKFLDQYVKSWQEAMELQRQENEVKHSKILEQWRKQRALRYNTLIEERRERRYDQKIQNEAENKSPADSLVSFDSVADQEDIDEVNKILDQELPPPIAYDEPNLNTKSFISKTEPMIVDRISSDMNTINVLTASCKNNEIRLEQIPLNLDNIDKTILVSYLAVEPIKFRSSSHFESCFNVSLELADKLLNFGYSFLSKFGKTCPVQYYKNEIPIQMFEVAIENNNLYPIIHRNHIYFIVGEKEMHLFKKHPLKYINQEFRFPLIRYKVGVTGPPKCGKTVLAQRIEKELGFKLITRGQAVRYVLNNLFESDLAKNMESVLRKGWELTDEMVIKSVEAASFDEKSITRGIIFDGFPNNLNEAKHLAYIDLIPNLIIDLQANKQDILDCLLADRHSPKYSPEFIMHLHDEWLKEAQYYRDWFDREYQAFTKIAITRSNWSVFHQSKSYIFSTFFEIYHYHNHIIDDWPLRLGNMLVTPLEFLERQSSFKTYCPVCLNFSNSLVSGGEPPDRTGLVQFRQYFYWICNSHIEQFLKCPEIYLPPYNPHGIPSCLPKRASFQTTPPNIYENGSCAVCYKRKRIITKGKLTLAATFNEKTYLFDSLDCLNVFLQNPHKYLFGIEFRAPVYPDLKYKDLPILGMLEQYLAKYIVQAVCFIAKRRPVIPGLGISSSALVGLGLFIKVKNDMPSKFQSYYEEGFKLYNERREKLIKYLDYMKTHRNPYLYYDEPLPKFELPPPAPSVKTESVVTMVSRILDDCVDNLQLFSAERVESTESGGF